MGSQERKAERRALGSILALAFWFQAAGLAQETPQPTPPQPTPPQQEQSSKSPCPAPADLDACLEELLAKLTLEEKAGLLSGADLWTTKPVERLGIPSIRMAAGPHGLRVTEGGLSGGSPATAFPTGSALAATWNPQLLRRVGRALADEAKARDVQVLLGPGLNLIRSPLGGRGFEYLSEDPVLAGELAAAMVQGIEAGGVAATVKHFVANHQETGRFVMSADIDPRPLRELYLRAFEIAVTEGGPSVVMTAYNRVNGVPMSEQADLLRGVLRGAWGFDGVVVSDWLAVDDPAAAHAAGLDLRMPGVGPVTDLEVVAAVRRGRLDEAIVDASVRRLLRLVLRHAGGLKASQDAAPSEDAEAHHLLAREAATRAMVLLRNAGDLLPLTPDSARNIAVIGAWALTPRIQGAGRSQVTPTRVDVPLHEIVRLAGEMSEETEAGGVDVNFAPAYEARTGLPLGATDPGGLDEALRVAAAADVAIVFVGTPPTAEAEGYDRADLGLVAGHDQLVSAIAEVQENVIVVLQNGGPVLMPWLVEVDVVLEAWIGGQGMGGALADVLFGREAPSGKLPVTFPGRLEQTATYPLFPSRQRRVTYGEGLFVGYRHFDAHAVTPLFPFGHGLSTSRFEYSDLEVTGELTAARSLKVSFTLTNRGTRRAAEVAQLYASARGGRLSRPDQTLADFARVELDPGTSRKVVLALEPRDVTVWDETRNRWVLDAERVEVRLGTSSREIRLRGTVEVVAPALPPAFDRYTLIEDWLADPRGEKLMAPLLAGLLAASIPPGTPDEDSKGLREFLLSLPCIKLLQLSGGALDLERLDAMIRQVNGS